MAMTQQTKNKNCFKLLGLGIFFPLYHMLLPQKAELSMPETPHILQCYKYLCLSSYQRSIVQTKKKKLLT